MSEPVTMTLTVGVTVDRDDAGPTFRDHRLHIRHLGLRGHGSGSRLLEGRELIVDADPECGHHAECTTRPPVTANRILFVDGLPGCGAAAGTTGIGPVGGSEEPANPFRYRRFRVAGDGWWSCLLLVTSVGCSE